MEIGSGVLHSVSILSVSLESPLLSLPLISICLSGLQISVETSSGKTISHEAKRSDTIKGIKAKIQDEKLLFFRGKQLEDGMILADYGIIRNCAIRLHFGLQIFVKIVYEEKYIDIFCPSPTITLGVESFDTMEHVKTKVQEKKGISPNQTEAYLWREATRRYVDSS
uniref:polyubiquitin-like n=1 Tax=Fragaria vesca subsp. vesca TaxID=101020 RepID=UPI0005CA403E|nr:PREDICTED: polyubiquitin-like [Fragaria vesca subsp. vesca]